MSLQLVKQIQKAIHDLRPSEIEEESRRRVRILVDTKTDHAFRSLGDYLCPESMDPDERALGLRRLHRASDAEEGGQFQLVFYQSGTPLPEDWQKNYDAFEFRPHDPDSLAPTVLQHRAEFGLALARRFPPFRREYVKRTVHMVSKENALFSIMTALPNVIPNVFELPWAIGEMASDTTVLTVNQIRMAFLIAAANGKAVGYSAQAREVASIVAGAWGWRAIARQLAGKIPLGGGLVAKATVAYAGTYVVGQAVERVYGGRKGLTKAEQKEAYERALSRGREVAREISAKVSKPQAQEE